MYLLFDNSENTKIIWQAQIGRTRKEWVFKNVTLLASFDKLLAKLKITPYQISGLAVVVGRGKFTATRIAVTMANILSFTLQIPVLGVLTPQEDWLGQLSIQPVGKYISAQYSAEPSIGKQKDKLV
ncbi:MAG: hypothetical protein WCX97_00535 [Candidatus Magasanikbacteria bacterium]